MRAAIFVDFDNLVSALRDGAGPDIAWRFAEMPAEWLAWLGEGKQRRHLVRRCYMNPAGFLEDGSGERVWYSSFRWAFQSAGFEVVDCPRLARLKNAADLRMALDCMDLLAGPAPVEEVTLLSSDSDFQPLLLRLRAADRRTRVVAHPQASALLRGAADEVIGLDRLARQLGWGAEAFSGEDEAALVLDAVRTILVEAGGPVHLPRLGKAVLERTGMTLRDSLYGGTGSLEAMVAALGLERLEGEGGGYVAMSGRSAASA